jgi:hypothetical protein
MPEPRHDQLYILVSMVTSPTMVTVGPTMGRSIVQVCVQLSYKNVVSMVTNQVNLLNNLFTFRNASMRL